MSRNVHLKASSLGPVQVGQKLTEVSPRGIHAIFERLRHVLHESTLDKRTQYMIEVNFVRYFIAVLSLSYQINVIFIPLASYCTYVCNVLEIGCSYLCHL
jgi:hypothetical protein